MSNKTCTLAGCESKHTARGYCEKHYNNLRYRGCAGNEPRTTKKHERLGLNHRKHELYPSWDGMRQRCSNPNSSHYALYGGRGIVVCARWQNSFAAFLKDMGERPEGMTLDRVENDGNYEPDNCRWATPTEQILNRRKNKNNTSGHVGVYLRKSGKWSAEIWSNYKKVYLGLYANLDDAISARARGEQKYHHRRAS